MSNPTTYSLARVPSGIEALDIILDQPGIHALEQRQILPERDGNAGCFQFEEERNEHRVLEFSRLPELEFMLAKCYLG